MLGKIIVEFLEKYNFEYIKETTSDGGCYFVTGLMHENSSFHVVLEYNFEENYFAITVANEKKLPTKYSGFIMDIYNQIAQQQIPITHIFTKQGIVASKYNYELLDEILSLKRIKYMLEQTVIDIVYLYSTLEKIITRKNEKI